MAVCGLKSGEYVRLIVDDTGMGMDEETASTSSSPTSHEGRQQGSGWAWHRYTIVRQMEGSIKFRSEPGKGAIFTILLPVYK
jgi:signal transduction histidine kinase